MQAAGTLGLQGQLSVSVTRRRPPWKTRLHVAWWKVRQLFRYRLWEIPLWCLLAIRWAIPGLCVMHGCLRMRVTKANGEVIDYGVVGRHLITTAGKQYVAACFDNTSEAEVFKYHGTGTGTGAAAIGDTALGTELTTEYATNSTRPTGSQGHSGATYTTGATNTIDSGTPAVTEWGLFSASSSGTLLDRQVFSAVNMVSGDGLTSNYTLTIA